MDIGIRQDLPKLNENSSMLIDRQKNQRDELISQSKDYDTRIQFLQKKIEGLELELFEPTMIDKIRKLRSENVNLLMDIQCLSNHIDLCGQQYKNNVNNANANNNNNQQRPSFPNPNNPNNPQLYPHPPMGYPPQMMANPQSFPMYMNQTMNPLYHLSPHQQQHQHPGTSRQISPNSPAIPGPPFYSYNRQGSMNILNQVLPPSNQIWLSPNTAEMAQHHHHQQQQQQQQPRRPSTLNLPGTSTSSHFPTHSNKPLPPPPTPPRPHTGGGGVRSHSRSPNTSDQRPLPEDEENSKWLCRQCTFRNHAALNSCEMCDKPKSPSHITIGNNNNNNAGVGVGVGGGLASPLASLYSQSIAHTKRIIASKKHRSRKPRTDHTTSATTTKDHLHRPGPSNNS